MPGKMTFGIIVGNRGFFPGHLAKTGRTELIAALDRAGYDHVVLTEEQSRHGAVETHDEAKRCAALFQEHRHRIDGVIVTLPNFGDERAIADTLRLARLDVPVLVQATPDATSKMSIQFRRDSFCGKMSACNNLRQYGIPYSLTKLHTVAVDSEDFRADLGWFAAVCRVDQRAAPPARRLHRRPAHQFQYCPVQRETAGGERHLHRDHRPVRYPRPHPAPQGRS